MATSTEKDTLLANGGTVDDSPRVNTPLQAAVLEGNTDQLRELIKTPGEDVNRVDAIGNTPLFTAVNKGNVEATKTLLQHGAKVDIYNKEGDTVIHEAAREDRSKILPLLLEKCEDCGCKNTQGEAAIHLAVMRGHTTIIERLCDVGADINQDLQQQTPLHLAIANNKIKTAIQLIEKGVRLDVPDKDGNVPLHLAADMGFVDAELVKLLVKKDEDMLVKCNNDGNTPLHIAANGGHYKSASFLIDHGSPMMPKNNNGDTPLHLAAGKGYAVTGGMIAKKDKQTCNVANNEGYLPLHKAVSNGSVKAVSMLLDMYTEDDHLWQGFLQKEEAVKDNLLDMALDKGHHSTAKALVQSVFWKKFMMTGRMVDSKTRTTPMLRLIEDMPEVAVAVLDQCLEAKGQRHIIANFELLDDRFSDWGLEKETKDVESMEKKLVGDGDSDDFAVDIKTQPFTSDVCALKRCHPMNMLSETNNSELLDHPLVRILLRRKWGRTAPVYFAFLLFYAIFISLVCYYMTHVDPPMGVDLCSVNNTSRDDYNSVKQTTLRALIIICVIVGLLTELSQMALTKLKHYLDLHNLCDWFTYVGPILVVSCFTECGAMTEWQYQVGIACVFVACMNLIYFIRIIPFLGIYVMMVMLMLRNFMQFFTIMFLFIIAFGICFFLLLHNQMAFSTPFFSIMKNWVMMVGEMDFSDGFHGHRDTDDPGPHMHYEPMTWFLYIMFLVFLSLIIMNLLTSLAVSGVETLQEDSKYRMLSLQIKLALNVEFALPVWLQHKLRCVIRSQTLKIYHKQSKALSKIKKWVQLVVYGDLCEEDIVKEAYQVVLDREEEGRKVETKKALTKKDVENSIFSKTKDMRLEVKEIDKNVENIEKKLKAVEDMVGSIHAMVAKLAGEK